MCNRQHVGECCDVVSGSTWSTATIVFLQTPDILFHVENLELQKFVNPNALRTLEKGISHSGNQLRNVAFSKAYHPSWHNSRVSWCCTMGSNWGCQWVYGMCGKHTAWVSATGPSAGTLCVDPSSHRGRSGFSSGWTTVVSRSALNFDRLSSDNEYLKQNKTTSRQKVRLWKASSCIAAWSKFMVCLLFCHGMCTLRT